MQTLKQSSKTKNALLSHLLVFGFSLLLIGVILLVTNMPLLSEKTLFLLLVIYFQLELFLWLGRVIFKSNSGITPKEITIKIVLRYLLFHVSCFVGAAIVFITMMALMYIKSGNPLNELIPDFIKWEFKGWFTATNIGLLFGAFIFFVTQWQEALKKSYRLREEKLAYQFETLNNQINPHFLFNSLNTLSSFISTQPDLAELYVNKLASIYRYITENASKNQISLDEEIRFIEDYFYLHKLRDQNKIELIINIPANNNCYIIPVSLQLLIENALKHNMATTDKPLTITVSLEENKVVVSNNLQKKSTLETSLKKGLVNLKERVTLATGELAEVIETRNEYAVKIPLVCEH